MGCCALAGAAAGQESPLHLFTLPTPVNAASYDETLAAACLQGIVNRKGPRLYLLPHDGARPKYWLDKFTQDGQWLAGREHAVVETLDGLRELAGADLKGVVIWDPAVPATVNVATTIAGVHDAVALSPELAEQCAEAWAAPVMADLRGRFDGSESGSAKNDAYRWAIREYLAKGRCSNHFLCLFEDAAGTRARGDAAYVVTRDWAVHNRAFVFDLSPWGDEAPKDDPGQPLGTDLATYRMMLEALLAQSAGLCMTELTGFFAFWKYSNIDGHPSAHDPVPTEWETVWLISPYNCYQNTAAHACYNQSLHNQAPFEPLEQRRPAPRTALEDKQYVCILMADYDSATPLYEFLPKHWDDPVRGRIPLTWGINPNLIETYPDLITHYYATATPNDHFAADASGAGYFNPNRVRPEYLPLFTAHNKRFFQAADMTIAPMVLDWDEPAPAVKDAYAQFAPDGYATIVIDFHNGGGALPTPHVWNGMPIVELINETFLFHNANQASDAVYNAIQKRSAEAPGFYFFRIVWTSPSDVVRAFEVFAQEHPDMPVEVLDPYNFFALFKRHAAAAPGRPSEQRRDSR